MHIFKTHPQKLNAKPLINSHNNKRPAIPPERQRFSNYSSGHYIADESPSQQGRKTDPLDNARPKRERIEDAQKRRRENAKGLEIHWIESVARRGRAKCVPYTLMEQLNHQQEIKLLAPPRGRRYGRLGRRTYLYGAERRANGRKRADGCICTTSTRTARVYRE